MIKVYKLNVKKTKTKKTEYKNGQNIIIQYFKLYLMTSQAISSVTNVIFNARLL